MEFDDVIEIRFALRDDNGYNDDRFQSVTVGKKWHSITVSTITVVLPPERAPLIKVHMRNGNTVIIPDAELSYFVQA